MATAVPPELPSAGPSRDDRSEMVEYDRYIATQIQRTRRQVKGVELASALLILATGLLAYGFLVAVIDSWVLTGGLGTWGRLAAFGILVAGAGSYAALRVLPLLRRRVNPIYAAHTIEQGQPSLKNSLINFLLLQGDRSRLPVPVYEAIERRAAQDLSTVPADSAVDRSPVIRSGYVLLALVTIFCLYSFISPKSPLKSLRRMLFPWSSVSAPTRVTIGDVRPGPARAFVGESLTISALVRGTRKDEPVTLYFTTEDGQSVDQPLPMQPPSDSYRHEVVLPPIGGLQQTLAYRIAAGDAQAGPYRVQVLAAPSILVEQVRYEYPAYTGLSPRVVERNGDLKAIEGTQVTLHAKTNVDITSAYVDFNCDGNRDLELSCNGRKATGTFEMRLDPERKPLYTTYQLLFTDSNKQLNPQPIRYKIEVIPDQTPEIEINQPGSDNYELPLNGALTIGVRASDRDFGLRRVTLFFERAGKRIHTVELLDKPQSDPFSGAHVFEPSKLTATPIEVGDVLQYWAEARDNRAPTANHVQTIKYRLKIVDKVDDGQREQQLADAKKKAEEAAAANKPPEAEVRPPDENTEKTSDPEAPAEEATDPAGAKTAEVKDPTGQEEAARPDPDGDAAAAMEKILEYQKQQEESPPDESESKQSDDPKSDEQKQSSEEQQDSQKKDEQGGEEGSGGQGNKSGKKEGGEGKSGSKSSEKSDDSGEQSSQSGDESSQGKDSSSGKSGQGNKSGSKQQPGKSQQSGSSAGSENKSDGSTNTDGKQTPNSKASSKASEKKQPGGKQQGNKQPGSKEQGGKPQGDKKESGANQPQDGSSDAAGESGDKPGNKDPKQGAGAKPPKQPSDQPKGGEQAGSDQQGEGKSGQQPQGDKPQPGQQAGKDSSGNQPQDGKQPQQGGKPNDDGTAPKQSSGEKPGDGDATAGSGTPEQNQEKKAGDGNEPQQGDQPMPTGGDPEQSKGEGGGGKPDSKPSPTPAAQEANQPRNQGSPPPDQKPGEKKSGEDASSPSNSPKQSKQHSDEQGDRSADGSKGGGQKSESPGTGSPGQNTESDEGSGEANQPGAGETKAGQGDQESEKPTGQPGGQQKGEGSSTKPSQGKDGQSQSQSGSKQPGGQQSGGGQQKAGGAPSAGGGSESTQPGKAPGNAGTGATPPPENPGNSKGNIAKTTDELNANDPNGKSTGGGQAGADANPDQKPFEPAGTQADPLNNDYAQRATDLALESLQEQMAKRKVDPELLEKLNWSQDDMQRFVDRWQQLKRDAAKQGPEGDAARKKLDDTMERLGAARRGLTINSRENGPDKVQRLREGRGSKPPAEYREQFEAYTEGAARRGK